MTLQQLEYIIALESERNFVKAAEKCRITQPTLTMQVQKLEDEIGFKLFDRTQKPLAVTPLGEAFIAKSRRVTSEVADMKIMVSQEIETVKGRYKVGIIPTLAPYLLPIFLPALIKDYPEIHLEIEELQSEEIIRQLKNHQLDFGLLATPLGEREIREVPIFNEPFLLYLPVNDPLLKIDQLSPESLHPENLLLLSKGHCFREQALNICNMKNGKKDKRFTYHSGSIEAIKGLVDKKIGYTLVPELSVQHEMKIKPSIRRFTKPEPSREISLVCHTGFSREKLIEVIRDTIQKTIPENLNRSRSYIRVKWR